MTYIIIMRSGTTSRQWHVHPVTYTSYDAAERIARRWSEAEEGFGTRFAPEWSIITVDEMGDVVPGVPL